MIVYKGDSIMRNIKLTLEYDGTRYQGWQNTKKGSNSGTISEKLTDVLRLMSDEDIELFCAARTEGGVHAISQTVNFKTDCTMPVNDIKDYLNHYLPQDIVILSIEEVPERFHASLNVKSQTYLYRVQTGNCQDVFRRKYVFYQPEMPDIEAMQEASTTLLGKHDFSEFSSGKKKKGTEKDLLSITITVVDDEIHFHIEANSFLHLMPRTIIATLLEIGYRKRTADCIMKILNKEETASTAVPAYGLHLLEVCY